MEQTKIEKAALKAKSEEMGIPFSAMLSGYVSEAFLLSVVRIGVCRFSVDKKSADL